MEPYIVGDNGNWFHYEGSEIGYTDTGIKASPTTPVFIPPVDGGGGLDTYDATAYPDHILKDYTAYARGNKLTGTYVAEENFVTPYIWYSEALNQLSGLELTVECTAKVGKVVLVCCHLRGALLSYTEGWSLVTYSPAIIGSSYSQTAYIFAKIATSTTEVFNLVRGASDNTASYFTWCCLDVDTIPIGDTSLSILGPPNIVTYSKPLKRFYVVCASCIYWGTNYAWVTSPDMPRTLLATSNPRLLVEFDEYNVQSTYSIGTSRIDQGEASRIAMCAAYFAQEKQEEPEEPEEDIFSQAKISLSS